MAPFYLLRNPYCLTPEVGMADASERTECS